MWLSAVVAAFVLTQAVYTLVNVATATLLYPRSTNLVTDETLARATREAKAGPVDRPIPVPDGGDDERVSLVDEETDRALSREESSHAVSGQTLEGEESGQAHSGEHPEQIQSGDDVTLPPELVRDVHVLVPVFGERPSILAETIERIYAAEYPSSAISVHVIYENHDESAPAAIECVPTFRDRGYDVSALEVDRQALAADRRPGEWLFTHDVLPKTKAAALTYAFMALSFDADDVITVFDSDTQVPPETVSLAVAGLEEYDIVQAKQTVRNLDDGFLPYLVATGIAAWSDTVYENCSHGPYQLLGKAYFTEARVIDDLDEWQLDAATEDMSFGMAAYQRGYTLGVIDRYVQDLCPARPRDWIRQKRRWVRGPYVHLRSPGLSLLEHARFWTATVGTQLIALTNVIGLPIGVLVALFALAGSPVTVPPVVWGLVVVNALSWGYYSYRAYEAVWDAIPFESRWERIRYALGSNPLSQAVYATLWVGPIALAVSDVVRNQAHTFEVTPKE